MFGSPFMKFHFFFVEFNGFEVSKHKLVQSQCVAFYRFLQSASFISGFKYFPTGIYDGVSIET